MKWVFPSAGWLVFLAVILFRVFGHPTDGQLITTMKANGSYGKVLVVELAVLAVLVLWLFQLMRTAMRSERWLKKRLGK